MAKTRSPSYPIVGLGEAIDKARLVWSKDYQAELPREVIVEHMGYGSLNGKSLGILATVAKFGLLEGRGDNTRVTDLAVQILAHERGDRERVEAIEQASQAPKLYQEISDKFDGRSPSDQALKSYLLTRGFTISGAQAVIRAFRETEEFVEVEVSDYDSGSRHDPSEAPKMHVEHHQEAARSIVRPEGVPTISMSDAGLEISGGVIASLDQFERLMRRLQAGKVLLVPDEVAEPEAISTSTTHPASD